MEIFIRLNELSKSERVRLAKVKENSDLLFALSEDKEWKVKAAVAHNKKISVEIIEKLYKECIKRLDEQELDEKSYNEVINTLVEIAKNSNTPEEILQELSVFENPRVRAAVLKNSKIQEETFQLLSKDSSWEVQAAVASHRKATTEMLYDFVKKENCNVKVKEAIAKSHKIPMDLLLDFVIDEDPKVSAAAIKNLRKKKR